MNVCMNEAVIYVSGFQGFPCNHGCIIEDDATCINECIDKATKPTDILEDKRNIQIINPTSKRCKRCLTEKLEILDDPDKNLLNKRSEIISQCRHKNKYRLKTLASNMTSGDVT